MKRENLLNLLSSVAAVVCGLLFGLVILLFTNSTQAFQGLGIILKGGFADGMSGIGAMLYIATPIIMTGLSVGFAFRTGLFNIGTPGQFTMGAYVAVYIGVRWTFLPPAIHWLVALIGAAIGGAVWGMIPGILKAFRNVNEVIASIMMNYIGMYLVNYLIQGQIYDKLRSQSLPVAPGAIIPKMGLDKLFHSSNLNIGPIIAVIFVILIYILIEKTTFGYELKACGMNRDASSYAGINEKKSIVMSMVIAGALAGIGGALLYLAGTGRYLQVLDVLAGEGFTGIAVALLGVSNPIGILFAGIFMGHIAVGGTNLQLLNFVPEIIDIIIAAIIYCGAFSLLFKQVILRVIKRIKKEEQA